LPTASKKTKLRLLELPESERKLKKGLKVGDKVGQYGVYMGERGVYHTGNPLNDLTGKEWVLFTKSWFIHNPPARKKDEMLHPAKFPESMIADFIRFFTKRNQTVLDPMLGSGSTLVACIMTERRGVGVELITRWAKIAKERTGRLQVSGQPEQTVIEGDARDLVSLFEAHGIGQADFCITSPPYWNMLKKSRGHVNSEAKRRKASGLDVYYSENPNDLGNIESYEDYLDAMYGLFVQVHDVLKDGGYLVIIAQNILTPEGEMVPLAWDLAKRLSTLYILKQERLWLQDNKMLGCWGYPWEYVSNVHHHYCLIFKKDVSLRRKLSEESHKPPEDTSDRATAPASAEGYREVVG
jgi:DNA modification methylase